MEQEVLKNTNGGVLSNNSHGEKIEGLLAGQSKDSENHPLLLRLNRALINIAGDIYISLGSKSNLCCQNDRIQLL